MTNPTADAAKLLPCPFCGSSDGIYTEAQAPWHYIARCSNCNAGHCERTEDEVIAKWNTRPQPEPPAKEERMSELSLNIASNKHTGAQAVNPRANAAVAEPIGSIETIPAPPADNVEVEIYLHSKEIAQTIADHTYWFCDICSNTHDECLCQPDALERGKKEIEHTLVDYGRHMYRLGLAARPKVEDVK